MQKMQKFFGAQDMTVGKPLTNLATFAIPLLIGNLAQQMYNTVDSIIVGKYVGDVALAAVGAAGPILNLLLLLVMGISTGAGILVAQYFGAKKRVELTSVVGTCITLTFIAGVFVMIIGPMLTNPLMHLLNTPDDVHNMAVDYLNIIFLGMLGCGYYNILAGVLRGMGDSISPLLFLLLACVLNIFLDLLFVAGFGMAADGVALATVIAQAISAALCLVKLIRMRNVMDLTMKSLIPDKVMTKDIVRLGLPSGATQAIFSLSAIIVQALTNSFGTTVIACSVVVMRVDGFAMMPNFTFGMAMTTYVGQNVGARRMDRVREGVREGLRAGLTISAILVTTILIFGKYLMMMFTSTPELVALGTRMLRILAVGYVAMAVTQTLSGVLRGAGDTMPPMWISVITTVVIRMPLAYLLAWLTGSPDALFLSLLIAWICGATMTSVVYRRGRWRDKAAMTAAAMEN